MVHLEMSSHDLILFVNIYGHQVLMDGWYVLQYFGGLLLLVIGTLHILAATTSSPLIMSFCMSLSSYLQTRSRNPTLRSCGLRVHCKPRGWWCIFHYIWI